ncbi:50S ribosomal protein L11 methyltransferase [Gemella morbillorum]|uniref:50S ribosomal protein L11 methyltransferase n=1 Tax=Gemella morbillorum TaxID=29391 RepID=UPI00254CC78A|nr:50S ribosomal protein L11 methyltransferase [Gemella morbillorum]MDK8239811.1 50S ribosomal protein L11 methyltransferase [Gemella morbillorum]MDK8255129.1 50S ribosomal protein L11 methyltransferase [Gemella morbillorum]HET4509987.1 50S ribosomal protein L11 methyltransferase [Streptococcus pneumoniae]
MENWIEITIHTTNEASEIVESILLDYGSTGVAIEDPTTLEENLHDDFGTIVELSPTDYPEVGVIVKGYINELNFDDETFNRFKDELEQLGKNINIGEFFKIETTTIQDSDWENSWKDYFDILNIGEKFVIVPTWREYENEEDKYVINIDPGMAFGTGGHETTSLCIKNLEKYVKPHDNIIDVGCGSGILSIAASYLTDGSLKAVDLDKLAVDVSRENFALNNLENRIEVEEASLLTKETKKYDVIVANILAHIIELMLEDAYKLLEDGGYFITSGIIKDKKDELLEKMLEQGFKLVEETSDNEWYSFVVTK